MRVPLLIVLLFAGVIEGPTASAQFFDHNGKPAYAPKTSTDPVFVPGFTSVNVAPGSTFNLPTAFAIAPDGRIFVAEKGGRVYIIQNGVKLPDPFIDLSSEILSNYSRGLMGIALDPNFQTNGYMYLAYVTDLDSENQHGDGSAGYGRVSRFTANASNPNRADSSTRLILLGKSWSDGVVNPSGDHTIDALMFATDGTLLVSAGDGAHAELADDGGNDRASFIPGRAPHEQDIGAYRSQMIGSPAGKILRIDPASGNGLPSNPLYDGDGTHNRSKVWVRGLRNPFRFSIRPGTGSVHPADARPGDIFIGDCGWNTWEELDVSSGQGGSNFGWPCYEGPYVTSGYGDLPEASTWCSFDSTGNLTDPVVTWHHSNPALSLPAGFTGTCSIGALFYTGTRYPPVYRGGCFIADFSDWIKLVRFDPGGISVQPFANNLGVPVDMALDPQTGDLIYVSIFRGEVRRVTYSNPGVIPIPVGSADPAMGPAPLAADFKASSSHDPLGRPLSYSWDLGDGTSSTAADLIHTYQAPGLYIAALTVGCADTIAPAIQFSIVAGNYGTAYDVTESGAPIASRIPGASNQSSLDVLHDRRFPAVGVGDTLQEFSTYDGTSPTIDYIGYTFPDTLMMSGFIYQEGINSSLGGWFGSLGVEVRSGGSWTAVESLAISPSYTGNDGSSFRTFVLSFKPRRGEGIRIIGPPGGSQKFVSAGECRVMTRNQAPQMHLHVSRTSGYRNLNVQFGSDSSLDPDGEPISVVWDFGDGLFSSLSNPAHLYTAAGQFRVILEGMDRRGGVGRDSILITVYPNTPPHAVIVSPRDSSYYASGGTISFGALATDTEQPESTLTYSWEVILHRQGAVFRDWYAATGRSFTYNTQDSLGIDSVYYEADLVVSDSGGLVDSQKVTLFPNHPPLILTHLRPFRTVAIEDSLYGFTLRALRTDPRDSLRVAVTSLPSWLGYHQIPQDSPNVAWRFSGVSPPGYLGDTLVAVRVVDGLGASDSLAYVLHIAPSSIDLAQSWNMVSFPRGRTGVAKDSVFPSSVSKAFGYNGGYQVSETLQPGAGYWLKFASSTTVPVSGRLHLSDTIPLARGWNMIGSLSIDFDAGQAASAPSGIVSSPFFGYDDGYVLAPSLLPGKAYWVKANGPGSILLNRPSGSFRGSVNTPRTVTLRGLSVLSFRTSHGTVRSLYFGKGPTAEASEAAELPPVPPEGAFDVRFSSQRYIEYVSTISDTSREIPIQLQSQDSVVGVVYAIDAHDRTSYQLIEREGERIVREIELKGTGHLAVMGRGLRKYFLAAGNTPRAYSLYQNYPNPFNPATIIRFDLPVSSFVTLKIYDILGREIASLLEAQQIGAGARSVRFDAKDLPSGVYLYRLQATPAAELRPPGRRAFSSAGKMVLVR